MKGTLFLLRLFGVQQIQDCHVKSEERVEFSRPKGFLVFKNVAVAWEKVEDLTIE